jgi:predicted DNA-binding protein
MATEKFSSKMEAEALKELRELAKQEGRPISFLLTEAVEQYLQRVRVRPVFRDAAKLVMDENEELLKRLAK